MRPPKTYAEKSANTQIVMKNKEILSLTYQNSPLTFQRAMKWVLLINLSYSSASS